jgi:hypothetical protein
MMRLLFSAHDSGTLTLNTGNKPDMNSVSNQSSDLSEECFINHLSARKMEREGIKRDTKSTRR